MSRRKALLLFGGLAILAGLALLRPTPEPAEPATSAPIPSPAAARPAPTTQRPSASSPPADASRRPRDPALVPGKPGPVQDAPPEARRLLAAKPEAADPARTRSPREYPEPPLVPPAVPERPPGVPPTPQGAGKDARAVARGEDAAAPPPATAAEEDAARAELDALLAGRRDALDGCIEGGAAGLRITVEALMEAEGRTGFASRADAADGSALPPAVEDCVLEALEVAMPAPAGANAWELVLP